MTAPNWAGLSTDEMWSIALQTGVSEETLRAWKASHNGAIFASILRSELAPELYAMFCRGELSLNTRTERNSG